MPKRDQVRRIDLDALPASGTYAASAPAATPKQYATLVVAAANSTPEGRAGADYVCDGSSDEAEISAAIAAIEGSGRVLLLEGTFSINTTIPLASNVVLEGQGDATVLQMTSTFTGGTMLNLADLSNVQLRNFAIDGNSTNHVNTIGANRSVNVTVDGIWFYSMNHARGVQLYGDGSDLRVINCRVNTSDATQAFVDIYAAPGELFTRLLVENNIFDEVARAITIEGDEDSGNPGSLPGPDDMTIRWVTINNNVYQRDTGTAGNFVIARYASGITISGNVATHCASAANLRDCQDVTIDGNAITHADTGVAATNLYYAEQGGGSQLYTIGNNTIRETAQCIILTGPPSETGDGSRDGDDFRVFAVISGNVLVNAGEGNISLQNAKRVTISGNTITTHNYGGTGTSGIEVSESFDVAIVGNSISQNIRAIDLGEAEGILIAGNSFVANVGETTFGIEISFSSNDITITGNYFYQDGIRLPQSGGASSDIIIADNTVLDGAIANEHTGTLRLVVRDNHLFDAEFRTVTAADGQCTVVDNYISGILVGDYTLQGALRGGSAMGAAIGSFNMNEAYAHPASIVTGYDSLSDLSNWITISEGAQADMDSIDYPNLRDGDLFIFSPAAGDTITVNGANFGLQGGADFVMDDAADRILLHYSDNDGWVELARHDAVDPFLVTTAIRPAADSTTAIQIQQADGTSIVNIDTTNGRIGIGVVPDSALDVKGDIKVTSSGDADVLKLSNTNNVATAADILIYSNGVMAAESSLYLNVDSDNDTTNAALIVGKDAEGSGATELMRVQENGNVGIGNGSPNSLLAIGDDLGSITGNRMAIGNASGNSAYDLGTDANNRAYLFWNQTSNFAVLGTQVGGTNYGTLWLVSGSLGFGTSNQFGSGAGVIGVANAATNPSTNPTGGGVLYSDSGAGKWRGSSGTTTTFGNADPHCPRCGRDYALEWDNALWGHFAVCVPCLVAALGRVGIGPEHYMIR